MNDLPDALFKRWIHAREEDSGGVCVYRPDGHRLPPARGRDGLEFRPDGQVLRFRPGADDRAAGVPGRWSGLPEANAMELTYGPSVRPSNRLSLVEVTDEVLKLRWLP